MLGIRKVKRCFLLLSALLFILGCIDELDEVEDIAKANRQVKAFLEEYPNADIRIIHLSEEEAGSMISEIRVECGEQISPREYYRFTMSDPDSGISIVSYVDIEEKITSCVMIKGKQEIVGDDEAKPTGDDDQDKPQGNETIILIKKVRIGGDIVLPSVENRLPGIERGHDIEVGVDLEAAGDAFGVSVEAAIIGYDHDNLTDDITDAFDMKADRTYRKTLTVGLPDMTDLEDCTLRIRVEDRDGKKAEGGYRLVFDPNQDEILIKDIIFSPSGEVMAGRAILATVSIQNIGNKDLDEGVKVKIEIPDLGVSAVDYIDGIEEDDSAVSGELYLRVPADAKAGTYEAIASVSFRDGAEEVTKEKSIRVIQDDNPSTDPIPRTDRPVIELFVMAHCPYAAQIERGMIPVMELLGEDADISIKFVSYAMHGEEELREEIRQYCIQAEQRERFIPYLKCFLKEGDSPGCVRSAGLDKAELDECFSSTDNEWDILSGFVDESTWKEGRFPSMPIHEDLNERYDIQGSPTLIINGAASDSERDPESLLETICDTFSDPPEECKTALSSIAPSPGFGNIIQPEDSKGQCG